MRNLLCDKNVGFGDCDTLAYNVDGVWSVSRFHGKIGRVDAMDTVGGPSLVRPFGQEKVRPNGSHASQFAHSKKTIDTGRAIEFFWIAPFLLDGELDGILAEEQKY